MSSITYTARGFNEDTDRWETMYQGPDAYTAVHLAHVPGTDSAFADLDPTPTVYFPYGETAVYEDGEEVIRNPG